MQGSLFPAVFQRAIMSLHRHLRKDITAAAAAPGQGLQLGDLLSVTAAPWCPCSSSPRTKLAALTDRAYTHGKVLSTVLLSGRPSRVVVWLFLHLQSPRLFPSPHFLSLFPPQCSISRT